MAQNNGRVPGNPSRRLTRQEFWTIVGAFMAAALLLTGYVWLWSADAWPRLGWLEGVLLNLGTAALLVVPIEWFSARLRHRVADIDARQTEAVTLVRDEAKELVQRVESLSSQVTSLAELQEELAARDVRRRAKDEELFRNVGTAMPTRDAVLEALKRAVERKLISTRGIRVPVADGANLRLSFLTGKHDELAVRLEDITGPERRRWTWPPDLEALTFFERVADAIDGEQEPRRLDIAFAFQRLAAALMVASTHHTSRPIIEHFPEQWSLTDDAIVTTDDYGYAVAHDQPDRLAMDLHVKQKVWLEEHSYESAYEVAGYLFPVTEEQKRVELRRIAQRRRLNS